MKPEAYAEIYWPGTSIKVNFEGTGIKALLKDEHGDNYFNIIIDDDSICILRPDTLQNIYTLASGLSPGTHSVELFKRNGWEKGKTWFYGFRTTGGTTILPAGQEKDRRIEFYGNSITVGYSIEDYSGKDRHDSTYTNNYLSYAAITARHFNAEYSCIARGGIGVMVSWYPLIMPEMYDRLDPFDENSHWDFSKYVPQLVIVNLFQNDSWIVNREDTDYFKYRFNNGPPDEEYIIKAYSDFISTIRKKYPESHIICMLGNMDITRDDSPWPGYVKKAVTGMDDSKIYTLVVPFKNTPGHPRVEEQQILADSLIGFITRNIEDY